jgi:cyclohexadieny/prephenate dehydrogenase
MSINTLTIVGVGLIGGSIGLAAKQRGLAKVVRGLGRDRERLQRALELGAIDEFTLDRAEAAASSDLIVVCTPVDRIVQEVLSLAKHSRSGTLLTDVGSTKAVIVAGIEAQLGETTTGPHFVGSHPLAGLEKQGVEFADANLFEGRWSIVTPTPSSHPEAVQRVADFWRQLGAQVRLMEPGEHDQALAMTSHLPHLLAAALAGILPQKWHELTASGFRDSTRIAAGDPELWSAIFAQNRESLLKALKTLQSKLGEFQHAIEADDHAAIDRLLRAAKQVRDSLSS